jgi:twitching motility two-component system response regulator PilH
MDYSGDGTMIKALVVDDSRTAADLLVMVLKVLDIEAHAAYGPGPGLALLKTEKPDAIFLDINMPGLSGFEILSFISREPHLLTVPVFVVTSDDQPETIKHALASGARAVLIKPISMEAIEAALQKESVI